MTTTMPAVGDRVIWAHRRDEPLTCTVVSMHAKTFSNPGGVTIVDDHGYRFSVDPLTWVDRILSGEVRLATVAAEVVCFDDRRE